MQEGAETRDTTGKTLASHSACRIVVTYDDGREAFEDEDCDVALEDGQLLVTYWDERGPVVLQGVWRESAFDVVARSRPSRATLVQSGDVLEGTWQERDESGGLRIELSAPEPEETSG